MNIQAQDRIEIEILEDGVLSISTGAVSEANHVEAQELVDSRRCQILGAEILAGEPATHLSHRVELVTRRSVALLGEVLLEVNGVTGQRPLYMHMRWFAHGRSSHLESKERSLRRTPGLCRAPQRTHGVPAGQAQAVPTILGIIRTSA